MPVNEQVQNAQQRLLAQIEKERDARIEAGAKAALASREGRELVWWLLGVAGVNGNPYRSNDSKTAFACGMLDVGLQLQARLLEADSAGWFAMMKEQENDRSLEQRRIAALERGDSGDDGDTDSAS